MSHPNHTGRSPLRIGLIGYGRIAGFFHLKILTELPSTQLVAIAEADPERREEARRRGSGAAVFEDYESLLTRSDADAVVVALPPALHAPSAIAAFRAGKHVYLEKPIATSLADAGAILEAWREAGTVGMMGFNFRYHPQYRAAREHIRAGTFGPWLAARSIFSVPARPLPVWKQTRAGGGGVLLDLASHHVDLARYLFADEVETVFAAVQSQRTEEDNAAVQVRLRSGVVLQSFCSMDSVDEHRFEVFGQQAKLQVRTAAREIEIVRASKPKGLVARLRHRAHALDPRRLRGASGEPSFGRALAAFARSVQAGRLEPGAPDLADGWRSLAAVAAAEESARTGEPIAPAVFARA